MMNTCDNCVYYGRPPYKSPCPGCVGFDKWESEAKNITNADHIRAMSDAELAVLLTDFSNNGGWVTETGREICYERHIEWLKQPYKEKEE